AAKVLLQEPLVCEQLVDVDLAEVLGGLVKLRFEDVELAPQHLSSRPPVWRDGQFSRTRRQPEVGVERGRQVLVEHALNQVQVPAAGRKAVGLLEKDRRLAPD